MSSEIVSLLTKGPHRTEVGRKQLTLAFGGLYFVSTTPAAKPLLVWETEKSYPRYYVPSETLHDDVKSYLTGGQFDHLKRADGGISELSVGITTLETIKGEGNDAQAVTERLNVGSRATTWVRFVEGPLKGFIRFERSEIGTPSFCP